MLTAMGDLGEAARVTSQESLLGGGETEVFMHQLSPIMVEGCSRDMISL